MSSPSWPYYLPTNPCCSTPCTNPCNTPDPCADPCLNYWSKSDNLAYSGANLPCTGIDMCDNLTVALQKIEEAICVLQALMTTTTSTTTINYCDLEGEATCI